MIKSDATIYANGGSSVWGDIQDFTKANCSSLARNIDVKVTDSRDGQIYTVRYINGNCWMTRNLAIGCDGNSEMYGSDVSGVSLNSSTFLQNARVFSIFAILWFALEFVNNLFD